MTVEHESELQGLRAAGRIVANTLRTMGEAVQPGVTTGALDAIAAEELRRAGARPAPALTYGFPGVACISINDEAAHGIAGKRVIRDGDLVKLDLSLEFAGFWADAAITVIAGAADQRHRRLCQITQSALNAGVAAAQAGKPMHAIGRAIEATTRKAGLRVIRELNGHGLGRRLHEDPSVPHYFEPRAARLLHEGLVLTVEPHVALGGGRIYEAADGWTLKTRDGSFVANFEHTIVITKGAPIVITAV
ncbi:MAG: type I methionyl aminopeptidase [Oscillochloris sp.]|nr:type I methionyl aminopeptidase [Oscillochloris sp.]